MSDAIHLSSLSKTLSKQQQIFLTCYYCQHSQQQCQSDILIDTKCQLFHVCYKCYLQHKQDNMQECTCKLKLKDHVKYKNTRKQYILDQGSKMYEKQLKMRSSWWQDLDTDFINIFAYYYRNGRGNQYGAKEKEIKNILKDLKKQENLIFGDLKKLKIPQFVNRQNNDSTGKQACGYQSNYQKGIKFLFQSFGL